MVRVPAGDNGTPISALWDGAKDNRLPFVGDGSVDCSTWRRPPGRAKVEWSIERLARY